VNFLRTAFRPRNKKLRFHESGLSRKGMNPSPTPQLLLGNILLGEHELSETQIRRVLAYQARSGMRFGEAAVELNLVTEQDVVNALSKQSLTQFEPPKLPPDSELVVAGDPYGTASETFRDLRSLLNLSGLQRGADRQALAVISPNARDGRTFIAANLAVAFSQLGRKTLLIDADMRQPRAHTCFNLPNTSGLSEMLAGGVATNVIQRVHELPGVYVLPVGATPPNPLELAESAALQMIIDEFRHKFDQVIVDTPAVEYGADARVISSKCGAVLMVCRKGRTKQREMKAMLRWVQSGSAHLAGMVINGYRG